MKPTHIPPDAVRLVNALSRQPDAPPPEDEVAAFRALCAGGRRWHAFTSGYVRDDTEQGRLDNVGFLWNEVEGTVDGPCGREILPKLVPPLYQLIATMDEINRGRAHSEYSQQAAINDLIAAGAARLEGRGEQRALLERAPVVRALVENLAQMVHGTADRLVPEVRETFDKALTWLEQALDDAVAAAEQDDADALRGALADLAKADGLLQNFLDWDRMDQERLSRQYARYRIPVVGSQLELAIESARKVRRGAWVPAVRSVKSMLLPQLHIFWAQRRPYILLPSAMRDECLSAVDAGIENLDEAVSNLLKMELSEEEVLDGLDQALLALSEAIGNLEQHAIQPGALQGTAGETWLEVIQGVLAETVPDEALIELVRENPPPESWGPVVELLKAYLSEHDPLLLCDAAETLAGLVGQEAPPEAAERWTCSLCAQANAPEDTQCSRCRQRRQALDRVEGWQA